MNKIRFLEKVTGILVHDHETALYLTAAKLV